MPRKAARPPRAVGSPRRAKRAGELFRTFFVDPSRSKGARAHLAGRQGLAAALGVAVRTVTKWAAGGMPVAQAGGPGRAALFDVELCQAWARAREAEQLARHTDLNEARAQREHWLARLAEQTHRARERELLPAEEVERVGAAERARVRRIVEKLPEHAGEVAAALKDGPAGVEVALRKVVNGLLRELAGAR